MTSHPSLVGRRFAALLIAGTMLGAGARLAAQAPVADSALTVWRERASALATPAFAATWGTTPVEFRRTWDAALESERSEGDSRRRTGYADPNVARSKTIGGGRCRSTPRCTTALLLTHLDENCERGVDSVYAQ